MASWAVAAREAFLGEEGSRRTWRDGREERMSLDGKEDRGLQPWAQGPRDQVSGCLLTPVGLSSGPLPPPDLGFPLLQTGDDTTAPERQGLCRWE